MSAAAGAAALKALLAAVHERAECDLIASMAANGGEFEDARDYKAIVGLIETSLHDNLAAEGPHREGYLRALADVLTTHIDAAGIDDEWDPIATTARAFGEACH